MKAFSILSFILSLGILAVSIYENQYHCLPFTIMSGILGWALWPEKKDESKPFRTNQTWKDYES